MARHEAEHLRHFTFTSHGTDHIVGNYATGLTVAGAVTIPMAAVTTPWLVAAGATLIGVGCIAKGRSLAPRRVVVVEYRPRHSAAAARADTGPLVIVAAPVVAASPVSQRKEPA